MTDAQLLALILGGTCLYAWMLWHLATTIKVTRKQQENSGTRVDDSKYAAPLATASKNEAIR